MINRITALLVFFISFIVSGCDYLDGKIDVEYKITGSANSVDVTYTNRDGGTSQESNVGVPWTKSFNIDCEEFLYISAQNQGSSGSVTARINVDGKKYKESTSTGAYVIASASGIYCDAY
jgi:hypothetical protein